VLPWSYDVEMGTATRYTLRRITASYIMKVLCYWHLSVFISQPFM